jgi:DNA-binding NarL/FixJ family response regulator
MQSISSEILDLYRDNPYLIDSADGIADRLGRTVDVVESVLAALSANCELRVIGMNPRDVYVGAQHRLSGQQGRDDLVKGNCYGFTRREQDVIHLLTQGLQYQEIARQLYVSYHTVKNHVTNIYRKMEVRNRSELMAKYQSL